MLKVIKVNSSFAIALLLSIPAFAVDPAPSKAVAVTTAAAQKATGAGLKAVMGKTMSKAWDMVPSWQTIKGATKKGCSAVATGAQAALSYTAPAAKASLIYAKSHPTTVIAGTLAATGLAIAAVKVYQHYKAKNTPVMPEIKSSDIELLQRIKKIAENDIAACDKFMRLSTEYEKLISKDSKATPEEKKAYYELLLAKYEEMATSNDMSTIQIPDKLKDLREYRYNFVTIQTKTLKLIIKGCNERAFNHVAECSALIKQLREIANNLEKVISEANKTLKKQEEAAAVEKTKQEQEAATAKAQQEPTVKTPAEPKTESRGSILGAPLRTLQGLWNWARGNDKATAQQQTPVAQEPTKV